MMSDKLAADKALIEDARQRGLGATFSAYTRLSGPGWLQSAITLGGGSLASALFLGVLGGTSLLWLQLVAILMGVIMLSAISYVTLSTGERPFRAINRHINPVLGWGWLIATCMANMIWCMPQFSLCYAALQKNLVGPGLGDSTIAKLGVSAILLCLTGAVVLMNRHQGAAAKWFDLFLKMLVGLIVVCFFGVVIYLGAYGHLEWGRIFAGFIPDIRQWGQPTGEIATIIATLPDAVQEFWTGRVVKEQRAVMIAAAATAVGINMTFLLPYSMLNRGWDHSFRGLARFDLCTGMAIPYILVTSCVVIASAATFHAKVDDQFSSNDPEIMQTSSLFAGAKSVLVARIEYGLEKQAGEQLDDQQRLERIAALPVAEKRIASSLVRRNAFQLSAALAPLLGERVANLVFGIGVFGMGFSTIIILMLINGFAFCEMLGKPQGGVPFAIGCLVSGLSGAVWPMLWDGPAKLWLAILASSFGMMLLPIAYVTFLVMINSKRLLGEHKPIGTTRVVWNVLMTVSVLGALIAAGTAVYDSVRNPTAGRMVMIVGAVYILLVIVGFVLKPRVKTDPG